MMARLKEFKWAAMIGSSITVFLFSTFATIAQVDKIAAQTREYVNDKHADVLDRVKDIQETLHRIEDKIYTNK